MVSNITYQVLSVTEANGLYRLKIEQLLSNGNVNETLSDQYFQQHIELLFHESETEWRFYYDTWNYQTYFCVNEKDRDNYPVLDLSKVIK